MPNKALKRDAGLAAFLFQFRRAWPAPLSLVVRHTVPFEIRRMNYVELGSRETLHPNTHIHVALPPSNNIAEKRCPASSRVEVWRGSLGGAYRCVRPFRLPVPH